ncbi:transmembrane protein [Perilla frutescens var. hirtella]|nr:transmembrane protein [Perilla frutescens var. hirtella]KAH6810377.1 transmembrane protein [Perilla frutescens var. frutescens]
MDSARTTSRSSKSRVSLGSLSVYNAKTRSRETVKVLSALPETAASVAVAATVVGAAATFLIRRTKSSEATEAPTRTCDDCEGSGVCSECKGEGFVVKRLSDQSAERARLMAKNAATRYTAGLPKKWSYCMKCSSARSCATCGGSGKLSLN